MSETKKITLTLFTLLSILSLTGCGLFGYPKPLANGYPFTTAENAKLKVEFFEKGTFFEGPSWDCANNELLFTAWQKDNKQVRRLTGKNQAKVVLDKTRGINGTFMAECGRLLTAEVFAHRICSYDLSETEPNVKLLMQDETLNQPNDLCVSCCGKIYFTDPDFRKKKNSRVYMLDGDGEIHLITDKMTLPNGIITSLDGSKLYVADSSEKLWKSFELAEDGKVVPNSEKIFFKPETQSTADPDGMTIDENGLLYFTGMGGVWCVSPSGKKLGFIEVPQFCSNVTFGGTDGKTLYITCRDYIYSLKMNVRGGSLAPNKFPCIQNCNKDK